jgi:MarR family transcriptional regulator, organic hydroperoxide resistance regulator
LEKPAEPTPFSGLLMDPAARYVIREIAWRFAYLRRVVISEMSRVLTPLGATVPLYHVLFRLATADGPLSQQELTLDAGLDAAGVSRLVARMANDKLVTIKVDAKDRRRRLVRLTAKGRALEESLSPLVDAAVRNMVTGFSDEEAIFLVQVLDKAVRGTMETEQDRRRRSRRRPNGAEGGRT